MTPDEAFAIGYAEGLKRPLTQAQADRAAFILVPHLPFSDERRGELDAIECRRILARRGDGHAA